MYRSDEYTPLIVKITIWFFLIIFIILSIKVFLETNTVSEKYGEIHKVGFFEKIPFLIPPIIFWLIYYYYARKLVVVEMDNEKIVIEKNSDTIEVLWKQVAYINMTSMTIPTTYMLRLKESNETYFFSAGRNYFSIPFFYSKDSSDMGKFIEAKKREMKLFN